MDSQAFAHTHAHKHNQCFFLCILLLCHPTLATGSSNPISFAQKERILYTFVITAAMQSSTDEISQNNMLSMTMNIWTEKETKLYHDQGGESSI